MSPGLHGLTREQLSAIAKILPHTIGQSMTVLSGSLEPGEMGASFSLWSTGVAVRPVVRADLVVKVANNVYVIPRKSWETLARH